LDTDARSSAAKQIVHRHVGLVARTVLVSLLTLVSRLLGFVRETLTGMIFGDTSAISDAFFTAWRVPNLLRRLLGEGALSTSLQTAMTETEAKAGPEASRGLFLRTVRITAWILLAVTVVSMGAVAVMPDRMPLTGWAWLGADPAPVRDLTLRLFPFVILICLAALAGGALNVRGHYAVPNLSPSVLNLIWIGGLLWIGWSFVWGRGGEPLPDAGTQWTMARVLAGFVLVGGVAQLALHLPALARKGLLGGAASAGPAPRPPPVAGVLRGALPLAFGAAVYQVNVMVDGLMAEGMLPDGGPTALYYANRVQQFPMALVALAAINAVFPALTAHGHLGDRTEVRRLHDRTQFGILFLTLPAAVGLFVLAEPISAAIFHHGHYGSEGIARIAAALRPLAIALVPAGAVGLAGRTYYAMGDFHSPVRVSVVMVVLNAALNWAFVVGARLDTEGLTLSTMITSWVNLALLLPGLRTRLALPVVSSGLARRLAELAVAASGCGSAAWFAAWGVARWTGGDASAGAAAGAVLAGSAAGAAAYFALAQGVGIREWDELRRRVLRRFRGG